MGGWHFRFFRRSKSFGPFRLNASKSGFSLTTKIGPVSHTRSTTGRHTTSVDLPGKGPSLRKVTTRSSRAAGRHRGRSETPPDHRGQTEEERQRDAEREALRARMAARRENIRRMREERRRGR